ncbi:hydrogenase-4 component A [Proteus mirabilis]|uniref:Hydrogenase-4 component A n=1 Tax=Proteus mirabilis TaxID=584 RepID=A0A2X2CDC5_PROMI|nr:hydrogenase-4 component A [Proteus mirabilis]
MAACSEVHQAVGITGASASYSGKSGGSDRPDALSAIVRMLLVLVCAQSNAITHEDNMIFLNESLCIGCKLCGLVCPFLVRLHHQAVNPLTYRLCLTILCLKRCWQMCPASLPYYQSIPCMECGYSRNSSEM